MVIGVPWGVDDPQCGAVGRDALAIFQRREALLWPEPVRRARGAQPLGLLEPRGGARTRTTLQIVSARKGMDRTFPVRACAFGPLTGHVLANWHRGTNAHRAAQFLYGTNAAEPAVSCHFRDTAQVIEVPVCYDHL